jgi:hypothetical protein
LVFERPFQFGLLEEVELVDEQDDDQKGQRGVYIPVVELTEDFFECHGIYYFQFAKVKYFDELNDLFSYFCNLEII